jgi:hypothetical protein
VENHEEYSKIPVEQLREELRRQHQLFLQYLKEGRDGKMQEANGKINYLFKLINAKS